MKTRHIMACVSLLTAIWISGCGNGDSYEVPATSTSTTDTTSTTGGSDTSSSTTTDTNTSGTTNSAPANTYTVTVVDDMVLNANVEANGCTSVVEEGNGVYTLTCSQKPDIIIAKDGYFEYNGTRFSIDMPLILNTSLLNDDTNNSYVVTPGSTYVANLSDPTDVVSFAKTLALTYDALFSVPDDVTQEMFRLFNLINTIAIENGVNDIDRYITYVRETIKKQGTAASPEEALNNIKSAIVSLKNDPHLKELFLVDFDGFITEVEGIDINRVMTSMQNYAAPQNNETMFTGFIYDAIIPNATIRATLYGNTIATTTADARGKWRMALDINKEDIPFLIFEASAVFNDQTIEFKSILNDTNMDKSSKKINLNDDINLVISNVTTAQFALAQDKLGVDPADWKVNNMQDVLNTIKTEQKTLMLNIAAAIKSVVDTNITITNSTLDFAQQIINQNGSIEEITTIPEATVKNIVKELPKQIVNIEDNIILNNQLYIQENDINISSLTNPEAILQNGIVFFRFDNIDGKTFLEKTLVQDQNFTLTFKQFRSYPFLPTFNTLKEQNGYQWFNNEWVDLNTLQQAVRYYPEKMTASFGFYDNNGLFIPQDIIYLVDQRSITSASMILQIPLENYAKSVDINITTPSNTTMVSFLYKSVQPKYEILNLNQTAFNSNFTTLKTAEDIYDFISNGDNNDIKSNYTLPIKLPSLAGDDIWLEFAQDDNAGKLIEHSENGDKVIGYYHPVEKDIYKPAHIKMIFIADTIQDRKLENSYSIELLLALFNGQVYFGVKNSLEENNIIITGYSTNIADALETELETHLIPVEKNKLPKLIYYSSQDFICTNVTIGDNVVLSIRSTEGDNAMVPIGNDGNYTRNYALAYDFFHLDNNFTRANTAAYTISKTIGSFTSQPFLDYDEVNNELKIYGIINCALQ